MFNDFRSYIGCTLWSTYNPRQTINPDGMCWLSNGNILTGYARLEKCTLLPRTHLARLRKNGEMYFNTGNKGNTNTEGRFLYLQNHQPNQYPLSHTGWVCFYNRPRMFIASPLPRFLHGIYWPSTKEIFSRCTTSRYSEGAWHENGTRSRITEIYYL